MADADEAGRGILAEAKREADAVLSRAREKAETERARLRARAKQRSEEEKNRIVTLAKLSARRDLLTEKQGLIDRVFEETRKRIVAMPADEYGSFIKGLLKRTIETGEEEVIVGEVERRIDQQLLDDVSRELGKPGGLKLSSDRRPIDGGFILRRGRMETNCALDTIIRDARERLETDVAGILFGREGGR